MVRKDHLGKRMWPFSDMSLEAATQLADWANLVFIGSLVCGVIATFVIVRASNVKEYHWNLARQQSQEKIAELQAESAVASERAAKLEREAQELKAANLALEAKIQPRRISGEKSEIMISTLSPHRGVPLAIASRLLDSEARDLGDDLKSVFDRAGWQTGRIINWTTTRKGVSIATLSGTEIPQDVKSAIDKALIDAGIEHSTITLESAETNAIDPPFAPRALYLLVGAKP